MDFFVSYTSVDSAWAEWIAWQLEAEGYQVVLQVWDFGPGHDWAHDMQRATSTAERVVAVLSPDYLGSEHVEAEWRVFYAKDPTGEQALVLPVRVREVDPTGLLGTRVYVNLVNLDAASARKALLAAARRARKKPPEEPEFPGIQDQSTVNRTDAPRFPGDFSPINTEDELPSASASTPHASDMQAINAFAAEVSESLRRRGFSDSDIDAFRISFRELVDNAATHVPGDKIIWLYLYHFLRRPYSNVREGVSLMVSDGGNGFDFNSAIVRGETELREREVEHGLLRACRLGSELRQLSGEPHGIEWMKERAPQTVPTVFSVGNVIPLVISYRQEAVRIGRNIHTMFQFQQYADRSDEFMDLIFDPLQRPALKYVGIEITGDEWSRSLHWRGLLDPLLSFAKRNPEFDKQFLLFADTGPSFQRALRKYCQEVGILMFEDESVIRSLKLPVTSLLGAKAKKKRPHKK
jgi:anti-sigma regulatory factor (Ser/Thr protein kinase)